MSFTIEKGIPIPPLTIERVCKYPFEQMERGDSIFVPKGTLKGSAPKPADNLMKRIHQRDGQFPIFTARTVTENGVIGWRIWREL